MKKRIGFIFLAVVLVAGGSGWYFFQNPPSFLEPPIPDSVTRISLSELENSTFVSNIFEPPNNGTKAVILKGAPSQGASPNELILRKDGESITIYIKKSCEISVPVPGIPSPLNPPKGYKGNAHIADGCFMATGMDPQQLSQFPIITVAAELDEENNVLKATLLVLGNTEFHYSSRS